VPASDIENAVRDYVEGAALKEAASSVRMSATRLRGVLVERNLLRGHHDLYAVRKRARTGLDTGVICAAYDAGANMVQIAKVYGVTNRTIHKRLIEGGVTLRTLSETRRMTARARRKPKPRRTRAGSDATGSELDRFTKAAVSRQNGWSRVSEAENELRRLLVARGATVTPQKAVGPYNLDLAVGHSVAVEVHGGRWKSNDRTRIAKRSKYLLDAGWLLVVVWRLDAGDAFGGDLAEYLVALAQRADWDPSLRGSYRVVRGSGETLAAGSNDLDNIALVPPARGRQKARR
jgi:very-short-patch-repair endonuclease